MVQVKDESINHLKPHCEQCFGLCCVALYFSTQDGFPADKSAGTPCSNLDTDFRCMVHGKLEELGLKGCAAYECFGAGQQVSQVTFAGRDWRMEPSSADLMFEAFLIMRQLHEMCWYLNEALSFKLDLPVREEIREALHATERIAQYTPYSLKKFDLSAHRTKIASLLKNASKLVRSEISRANRIPFHANKERKSMTDYFGRDLRKKDIRCEDLRGACLIAANLEGTDLSGTDFMGADFRDANLREANLSKSIFLTQFQINAAKGNSNTMLPPLISRPQHW
nr:pentapeptide repeat-containing protein [uncultured Caproiciproducens sp.]